MPLVAPLMLQTKEVFLNEMNCLIESEQTSAAIFQPFQQQQQTLGRSKCGTQSAKSLKYFTRTP